MSLKSWNAKIAKTIMECCDPDQHPRYDEFLVRKMVYRKWPDCNQTFMVSIVKHGKDYWETERAERAARGHNQG